MKKILASLILPALVLTLAAGCSGSGEPGDTTGPITSSSGFGAPAPSGAPGGAPSTGSSATSITQAQLNAALLTGKEFSDKTLTLEKVSTTKTDDGIDNEALAKCLGVRVSDTEDNYVMRASVDGESPKTGLSVSNQLGVYKDAADASASLATINSKAPACFGTELAKTFSKELDANTSAAVTSSKLAPELVSGLAFGVQGKALSIKVDITADGQKVPAHISVILLVDGSVESSILVFSVDKDQAKEAARLAQASSRKLAALVG